MNVEYVMKIFAGCEGFYTDRNEVKEGRKFASFNFR
jgi:hypothetical protein